MTFIANRELCGAFRKNTAFSRESVTRCSYTQLCQLSESIESLMQLKGHQKVDYREPDGPYSIWQGKPTCWG